MKTPGKSNLIITVFISAALLTSITTLAVSENSSDPRQVWMSFAKGQNEIGLKIWTQKKEGEIFSRGEPIILNFETSRKAYVVALNVSPKGDVMVLFPNGESPDNLILPGKTYTLFGSDSSIQVTAGDKIKEALIIFYVSSQPFKLDPFNVSESKPIIKIAHTDTGQIAALAAKIESMAQDEGFNRQAVTLKAGVSSGIKLELMGPKGLIAPHMESPASGSKSSKPGGLTGGQGEKPENERLGKE